MDHTSANGMAMLTIKLISIFFKKQWTRLLTQALIQGIKEVLMISSQFTTVKDQL